MKNLRAASPCLTPRVDSSLRVMDRGPARLLKEAMQRVACGAELLFPTLNSHRSHRGSRINEMMKNLLPTVFVYLRHV